jgi:hypothetical protein
MEIICRSGGGMNGKTSLTEKPRQAASILSVPCRLHGQVEPVHPTENP